jgi:hypothetical protein
LRFGRTLWREWLQRHLLIKSLQRDELDWTNTPVYEWQIQDQSASDGRVHFALFNTRVKKYLVYKVQNYGINLG